MAEIETATLAGGCFWCTESVFDELRGVASVVSGYSGGHTESPTYQEVCSGSTGHAEVIDVKFDPAEIEFADILRVFLTVHDPTTLNRQGGDIGTQYRSSIFYHSDEQRRAAEDVIREIDEAGVYASPIVTEIVPFEKFWPAEDYHQEYFVNNPNQPYCTAVIAPKVAKFRKMHADRLKR